MRTLTYRLERSELEVWARALAASRRTSAAMRVPWSEKGLAFLVAAVPPAVLITIAPSKPADLAMWLAAAVVLTVGLLLFVAFFGTRRQMARWVGVLAGDPLYCGPFSLSLDAAHPNQDGPVAAYQIRRSAIARVTERAGLILVWFAWEQAVAVPARIFDSAAEKAAFIAEVSGRPGG